MTEQDRANIIKLAENARAGDTEAFEQLYRRTAPSLRSVCARYFGNAYDIDEALQETYVRIYRSLGQLGTAEAFFTWSRTIAQNTCLNMIRSRNLVSAHETFAGVFPGEDPEEENDISAAEYRKEWNPEAAAENEMKARILQDILNSVSDVQRSCILLWAEGYTYQNIAQRLGMPAGSVKSTVHYTKKKITGYILKLEKEQGISLHSMAPIPYFLWLLENDPENGSAAGSAAAAAGLSAGEFSVADLAGLTAAMEELSGFGAGAGAGVMAGDALTGAGSMLAGGALTGAGGMMAGEALTGALGSAPSHARPAFLAAAVLFLALLLPAGSTLAASMTERVAPQEAAVLAEAVHEFQPSNLVSGGSASESDRTSGIGAESGSSETIQSNGAAATAEVAAYGGQSTSDDHTAAKKRPAGSLHSREGSHPEEGKGSLWHRMAGVFSPLGQEDADRTGENLQNKNAPENTEGTGNENSDSTVGDTADAADDKNGENPSDPEKTPSGTPEKRPADDKSGENTAQTSPDPTQNSRRSDEDLTDPSGSGDGRDQANSAGNTGNTPSGSSSGRPQGDSSGSSTPGGSGSGNDSSGGSSSRQESGDPSSGTPGMNDSTENPVITEAPAPGPTASPTAAPSPTGESTPSPTAVPTPAPTAVPTSTPEPTQTPEPTPEEIPIQSFRFTVPDLDFVLNAYEPIQIPYEIYPPNATEKVVWSNGENDFVEIDENGVATFYPPEPGREQSATMCVASTSAGTFQLWSLLSFNSTSVPYGPCGDNASWRLDGNTLVISGSGVVDWQEPDAPISQARWIRYGSQIYSIQIEEGITDIGGFWHLQHVNEVVIPEGVTRIDRNAFLMSKVTKFYLPKSLEILEAAALNNGYALPIDIVYAGSEEDWNNVYDGDPDGWRWMIQSITYLE
ncbi:MAG: sigma-70 family RNA polymerase sigma factor [Lachnospiraceae bacterium]|nr:sigma-70 family RNA polymerase sigma factor [Lachnospiraceae bacterium]